MTHPGSWVLSTVQEEPPRSYRGERPTLVSTLTDRRMDAAIGNQNKVKYMATQLLAKFEENAPAQSTGLRRQVSPKLGSWVGRVVQERSSQCSARLLGQTCSYLNIITPSGLCISFTSGPRSL